MKLFPCPRCGTAKGPGGGPIPIGRLSSPEIRLRCRGCGQGVTLRTADWNRLPECPAEEAQGHLDSESASGGLPPFQTTQRLASSLLSPLSGKLVR